MQRLYTIKEIAARMNVTTLTVHRWLYRGILHPVSPYGAKRHLIAESDLETFITSNDHR